MTPTATDPMLVSEARRRVHMKTGLRLHAAAFVLVCAGMLTINLLTTPEVMWFWFPFFGWLLGLAGHAALVGYLLSDRADRAVQQEVSLLRQRSR
jgi:hypothetical protein